MKEKARMILESCFQAEGQEIYLNYAKLHRINTTIHYYMMMKGMSGGERSLTKISLQRSFDHITLKDIRALYNAYFAVANDAYTVSVGEHGFVRNCSLGGHDAVDGWVIDLVTFSLGGLQ